MPAATPKRIAQLRSASNCCTTTLVTKRDEPDLDGVQVANLEHGEQRLPGDP